MELSMPDRRVYARFHLDTNRINARQSLARVNRLEKWAEDEIIELHLSELAQSEGAAVKVGDVDFRGRRVEVVTLKRRKKVIDEKGVAQCPKYPSSGSTY